MWAKANPAKKNTIGSAYLLKLLSTQFGLEKISEEDYRAIFAKTEFNMIQEIDQYELAIFLLSMSSLEQLIEEDRFEKRLQYRMFYPHLPYAERCKNRELRQLQPSKYMSVWSERLSDWDSNEID